MTLGPIIFSCFDSVHLQVCDQDAMLAFGSRVFWTIVNISRFAFSFQMIVFGGGHDLIILRHDVHYTNMSDT